MTTWKYLNKYTPTESGKECEKSLQFYKVSVKHSLLTLLFMLLSFTVTHLKVNKLPELGMKTYIVLS